MRKEAFCAQCGEVLMCKDHMFACGCRESFTWLKKKKSMEKLWRVSFCGERLHME